MNIAANIPDQENSMIATSRWLWCVAAVLPIFIANATSAAPPPPATSLNNCQHEVNAATKQFITKKVTAIGTCLQAVSTQIVKDGATASRAATTCVTQFRKLYDSRGLGAQLSDKLGASIVKKCAPGQANVAHTLGDILGAGAGVAQPLDATNLNAWCSHFGGDGSIDTVQEWIDCITAAAECAVDTSIGSEYPRAIEWLNLVRTPMQAPKPPATDPSKILDAVIALDAVKAELDGPDNDNV